MRVMLQRLAGAEGLPLPAKASDGSAGYDLRAARAMTLPPGDRALVPTGFAMALPEGWEGQVRPRSGIALKHGVTVLNAPGTVDCDYRGEVGVVLINHGDAPFVIERGDRIAQLVLTPVAVATIEEVDALPPAARGESGFGSTGSG